MTRYLLDTGIASDYVLGIRRKVAHALRHGNPVGNDPARHRSKLERNLRHLRHWPFEKGAGAEFGGLMAELRRKGRPMQQVDVQIAAIGLSIGCTIVTRDSDFRAIPGLTIEDWSK